MGKQLNEGLEYKSMKGMLKPTLHIDEFASKMGDDDDICVVSFYISDQEAAKDLVSWFEKGYDFVMDADRSPGEIDPNKYLVYIELKRRTSLLDNIETILDDLTTLTEYVPEDWMCKYGKEEFPYSQRTIKKYVPLSPKVYRSMKDDELNKMRTVAGVDIPESKNVAQDVRDFVNLSTNR